MKALFFILIIVLITACGDKSSNQISNEIAEPVSLKGHLIDGYPTVEGGYGYSVLPGQEIAWHVNAKTVKEGIITINDALGREVDKLTTKVSPQTIAYNDPSKNGFGYAITFKYKVPATLSSGVYYLNNNQDYMFVVLPIESTEIMVVIPTNSMNAYSCAGGKGLYACPKSKLFPNGSEPIPKVSFARPIRSKVKWTWDIIGMMTGFLQWAESHLTAYDVGYITDKELDDSVWLADTRLMYIPGHNEYWSLKAKNNVASFLDQKRHIIVLGGNIMWWHARYEGNSLVSYKHEKDVFAKDGEETNYLHYLDGQNAVYTLGANFHYGGYHKNVWDADSLEKNAFRITADKSPIFDNTGIKLCDEIDLSHNHEFDGVPIFGFSEAGLPVPAYKIIKQHKVEILGYTWGYRGGHTIGTIHAAQRTPNSGYLVQFGSNGAAGFGFTNGTSEIYKQVLENTQKTLLNGLSPFSPEYTEETIAHELRIPYGGEKSEFPYEKCARN
mgnify:CR=1 FL=1